jgi:hypothetical protein
LKTGLFDDLVKMSKGVTYINIAIPLNISIIFEQIEMFSNYLDSIIQFNSSVTSSKSELIPEYIEDNHDAMDPETLNTHVDYIQRTKRE